MGDQWEINTVNAFFAPDTTSKILQILIGNIDCDDLVSVANKWKKVVVDQGTM